MQVAKFPNMGFVHLKKFGLISILIIASQLSASFAGGQRKLMDKSTAQVEDVGKESPDRFPQHEVALVTHPRFLRVKTNDYGRYDPAPTFAKPPFKLIPN